MAINPRPSIDTLSALDMEIPASYAAVKTKAVPLLACCMGYERRQLLHARKRKKYTEQSRIFLLSVSFKKRQKETKREKKETKRDKKRDRKRDRKRQKKNKKRQKAGKKRHAKKETHKRNKYKTVSHGYFYLSGEF